MTYKIVHDRDECIACKSCAQMCPSHWKMDEEGLSTLKENMNNEKILEDGFDDMLEVAQSCPVNIIHLEKDGERLI